MSSLSSRLFAFLGCFLVAAALPVPAIAAAADAGASAGGVPIRVLFLGDDGHHRPADRFKELEPVLARRGIELEYTGSLVDLNAAKLAGYDALVLYANHTHLDSAQEQALLDFVAAGGGFVPLHCASACFVNSDRFIELVGAQFRSHGTGVFREHLLDVDHPVRQGLSPIESWDETYVHSRHNPARVVLAERRDDRGAEPWTWVREHGRGRVFYTAWGHDARTWTNAGFQTLVERGIRWASENSHTRLTRRPDLPALEQMEAPAPLPNYVANARWGTQGEPITRMQKPLEPARSLKHLVTFPEFEVSLFASEPDIFKPIWLAWDHRGRLWIAETVDYPNDLQPDGQGRDRITICEDLDGNGRADSFTVFADKLSIPTGFVFANDGIIVIHSGRTEFLRDTDGDDRADERRVLFEGWGMGDTHATASNLRYGFDNWIWGTVGYSGFRGSVGGKEIRFGQGIFRFKPDGSALEFVRSSNNNTWGLGLSEEGLIFGSTANGNASMYMPIPNRYYEAVDGWSASRLETIADSQRFYPISEAVRQVDFHGRYTAGSGSALYTARSFPREYWNCVQFVAEPTGHLLGKFHLEPRGADYVAHNGRNFLASDDEWCSPIAAEVGPDGALWVSDWYNYIIQHNPTPQGFETGRGNAYATPLRDKTHGRIYRVTHRKGQFSTPPRLRPEAPSEWVAALRNDNLLWRLHAQRLLVHSGNRAVLPALVALVRDTQLDELGLNPGAIHALWTLQGLGALEEANANSDTVAAVKDALRHPSGAVRRTALAVLPRTSSNAEAILAAGTLQDQDAQVRLAALLALAEMPPVDRAGAAIAAFVDNAINAKDRWLADAAIAAAARNDAAFLRAVFATYRPVESAATVAGRTNLLANASFEQLTADADPAGWRRATHSGRGELTVADGGRTGNRSVRIRSETGGDVSWAASVPVQRGTDYRLTAWIRTENVEKQGGALGALLNVHELQDARLGATPGISGTRDWTQVALNFNSGDLTRVTINCLFGGWGRARGTAWFDDVELVLAPGSELTGPVGRVIRTVTTHYARRGPVESIVDALTALKGASPDLAVAVLEGLVAGWPEGRGPVLNAAAERALRDFMREMPEESRDRLLALSQRWGLPELFRAEVAAITASLKKQVADAAATDEARGGAARRLVALDSGAATLRHVLEPIGLLTPPGLATGLINALAESRTDDTAAAILEKWPRYSPAVRRSATALLMRRAEWTRVLLDAVAEGRIPRTDVAVEQWAQLKQNPNRTLARLADRLSQAVGPVSADRQAIVEKLLPLAKEKGDMARGREVYRANCAVCHVFHGEGGAVGPDLTGIAARERGEILLEILDPNRSVEANFRMWNVTTKDGELLSGRLEAETQTTIELLDTVGQKHVIQRANIAGLDGSQLSVMPAGFEALPEDDLKGLLEYLAAPRPD